MSVYPIDSILPELLDAVRTHPSVIVHAPPGAGKTTRVPLALLEALPGENGRIVMLEPRRIAAVSAARWMAQGLGEDVGETVGYTIRFDRKVSSKTRLEVVTEGVLTRRLQSDPGLEGTALVIFDEFHERSIHADLALALCLDIRKGLREDLKVLIMSATLDAGPIAALLDKAPVISSSGKSYPVEERYLGGGTGSLAGRITDAVKAALREAEGDILVFLPGSGEIRACAQHLKESLDLNEERLSLHVLYGDLPFEEQERAIMPLRDRRKIVLATNIAETSLTIEGVQIVLDSGLTRLLRYDVTAGMNRLVTVPVSRASAEQRKGRAGRTGPGVCYRLFTRREFEEMLPFSQPEILVSDLSQLVLELAVWGVNRQQALAWLDEPPAASWESARRLLRDLGALDPSGSVTSLGREMVRFPLHPRLSRLMLRSRELGCVTLGADLASLLTERDIFRRNVEERDVRDPDVSARIDALRAWRLRKGTGRSADPAALRAVERTSRQLLNMLRGDRDAGREEGDPAMVPRLLLSAFPDRICRQREEGGHIYIHTQGRAVRLAQDSHLRSSLFIVAVQADAGERAEGLVHLAAPVSEDLIRADCAECIERVRRVAWDQGQARVVATVEERVGSLLLSSRPFVPADEEALPVLCDAVRRMPELLDIPGEARQLQARVALMRRIFPGESWPDFSDGALFTRLEEWLAPWLSRVRTAKDLGRIKILQALKGLLTWEQQRLLDEHAPLALTVPSGSSVTLDYVSGDVPVLAVKLQEMFGLADTPAIAKGRVRVLLHLLSPARRPVQITRDLKGFWDTVYPEVKKDLKGRYPKHPWPDDPWNAAPTRRTKPR